MRVILTILKYSELRQLQLHVHSSYKLYYLIVLDQICMTTMTQDGQIQCYNKLSGVCPFQKAGHHKNVLHHCHHDCHVLLSINTDAQTPVEANLEIWSFIREFNGDTTIITRENESLNAGVKVSNSIPFSNRSLAKTIKGKT